MCAVKARNAKLRNYLNVLWVNVFMKNNSIIMASTRQLGLLAGLAWKPNNFPIPCLNLASGFCKLGRVPFNGLTGQTRIFFSVPMERSGLCFSTI
jgi:hypothetical protein